MATQLQIRRGTTAQMNAFTGAEGELAVNTTTDTVHVHDGSTAGGFALAKADGSNIATYAGSFTTLAASGASTLTGAVGINIAPTSYKLTVNSGSTTATTAAAIGYNGDEGTNLYVNTDHGNNLVSLYASGSASKTMRFLSGTLEVMRLGTTGNVGIGTSSPNSYSSQTTLTINGSTYGRLDLESAGTLRASLFATAGSTTFSAATDLLTFDTSGGEAMRIDSSGNLLVDTTTANAKLTVGTFGDTARAAQFHGGNILIDGGAATEIIMGDGNVAYMSIQTTDDATAMKIRNYSGNSDLVTVDRATGNVGIGMTPDANNVLSVKNTSGKVISLTNGVDADLYVDLTSGLTLVSPSTGTLAFGTANTERMRIAADGSITMPDVYNDTTAAAANMHISSAGGLLFRSTSSARYKNTITDATHGLTELLTLRSVTYKGNNDGDTVFGGLIAEEVHDAGLTEFVQYNDEDEPDALAYGNMVSLCIKAIQELKEELNTATARITELENN